MTTLSTKSVFDRLSRKQTAASIGQKATSTQRTSTSLTASNRSNFASSSRRPVERRMTKDMRMSMLDELEEAEQIWPNETKQEIEIDDTDQALLEDLLKNQAPVPSAVSQKTNPVKPQRMTGDVVNRGRSTSSVKSGSKVCMSPKSAKSSKPINTRNAKDGKTASSKTSKPLGSPSVFERLYQHETKASIGQQVESIRQQSLAKIQSKSKCKAVLIPKKSKQASKTSSANTVGTRTTCSSTTNKSDSSNVKKANGNASFVTPKRNRPWQISSGSRFKLGHRTPVRTPDTIYTSYSDDSSASTVSSLVNVENPSTDIRDDLQGDSKQKLPHKDSTLDFLFLPNSSSSGHTPWKMALSTKTEEEGTTGPNIPTLEPLYLRCMSNIFYEFASGNIDEAEIADHLITALFHRDFESGKFWQEDVATVLAVEGNENEYKVKKSAQISSALGGSTTTMVSSAIIRFDYTKRLVAVLEYHHWDECTS